MDKLLICDYCQQQYNLKERLPKMLIECGHTIC